MVIVVTVLCVVVFSLMVRVHLLEKNIRELALDILELNFEVQDIVDGKIAERWLKDWDLGDTCCKD